MPLYKTIPKLTSILGSVYPIGCIYTETTGTNPGTTFGFGTWSAYGAGRVMVSKAAAGTFSTAGATGGAETHTLITAELASHSHASTSKSFALTDYVGQGGGGTSFAAINGSDANTATAGSGNAHNNLQPYIVVYVWTRTA